MQIITNQFQKELKEHGDYRFPLLVSYEKLSAYETGSFLWHWHPEIELTLVEQGEMLYHFNNQTFHVRQGQAIFGNTNALHMGEMYENQDCVYTPITFDPRLIYGYDNSLVQQKYVDPITQNFALSGIHFDGSQPWHLEAINLICEIISLYESRPELYEMEILTKLQKFWQLLYHYCHCATPVAPADHQNHERIRQILEYIAEHYASHLYLEDIAAHIGLCKSECCRLFKRYMKVSLFEFLLEYRIEQSLELLIHTNCSIVEVAEKAGFNDSNYYSKVFRKIKGCTPSGYRKRMNETVL